MSHSWRLVEHSQAESSRGNTKHTSGPHGIPASPTPPPCDPALLLPHPATPRPLMHAPGPSPQAPMALTLSPPQTPSWPPTTPSLLQLGDARACTDLLIKTVRVSEAVLFAHLSTGKHEVVKVSRHNVRRDSTVDSGGTKTSHAPTTTIGTCR